jgi:hypothetical protein
MRSGVDVALTAAEVRTTTVVVLNLEIGGMRQLQYLGGINQAGVRWAGYKFAQCAREGHSR